MVHQHRRYRLPRQLWILSPFDVFRLTWGTRLEYRHTFFGLNVSRALGFPPAWFATKEVDCQSSAELGGCPTVRESLTSRH
jgi:hypothetical protein